MSPEEIQKQIQEKATAIGQRVAQAPTPPNIAGDPELGALRGQHADKVRQLFAYDSNMAQVKFQPKEAPGPHAEGYTAPTERIIDPLIGRQAASLETAGRADELATILSRIAERRAVLDDTYNKALSLHEKNIKQQESELSALQTIFENAMKMKEFEAEEEERRKKSEKEGGLQTFLDTIMGLKERRGEATLPTTNEQNSGYFHTPAYAKNIEELRKVIKDIKKTLPEAEIRFTKNKDGSYEYVVQGSQTLREAKKKVPKDSELRYEGDKYGKYTMTKKGQQFITEEEAGKSIFSDLLNAFTAQYPEDRTDAEAITKRALESDLRTRIEEANSAIQQSEEPMKTYQLIIKSEPDLALYLSKP